MNDRVVKDITFLRQKSTDVTSVDEAKELISKLEDTLRPISHGVGLAAIQIGVPKKVGVIKRHRTKGNPDFIHLINPVVVSKEEEFIYFNEGCLSFPDIFRNTKRYRAFTIKHQRITEENKFEEQTLYFCYDDDPSVYSDGVIAIAVQHEMDHFSGELIIDSEVDINLKPTPIVADKKIGRNELCPCGSGKKYKKCCLNN